MISIYFYDRDQSGIADIDVEMLRRRWDSERRQNTDAQIDDRRTASVDRSENVDESTTGSASDWSTDKLNSVTDL
jgi:hypothetical protein